MHKIKHKIPLIRFTPVEFMEENIINYLEEYMENGSEEAPKYFESLCKKYGVDLGE